MDNNSKVMENMEETLEEFDYKLKKRNQPRKQRIWRSWRVQDFYKWLRRRKWKDVGERLTEEMVYALTRDIFKAIANKISYGETLHLGQGLGKIEIVKRYGNPKNKGSRYGVDWKKTIKLWYEDKEAMEKRTLVRIVEREIFRITYNKNIRNTRSMSCSTLPYIMLYPNRTLKLEISKHIKEGSLDAVLMKEKNT